MTKEDASKKANPGNGGAEPKQEVRKRESE
jgi:hypothetical protein